MLNWCKLDPKKNVSRQCRQLIRKERLRVSPYEQLETRFEELHHLGHTQAMLSWDEAVMMPRGGGPARGEALAALAALAHRTLTAPEVGDLLDKAEQRAVERLAAGECARDAADAYAGCGSA
jgi:Zn-dependent M32 family carboxypeptidase